MELCEILEGTHKFCTCCSSYYGDEDPDKCEIELHFQIKYSMQSIFLLYSYTCQLQNYNLQQLFLGVLEKIFCKIYFFCEVCIIYNLSRSKSMLEALGSSTPNGLAPLSNTGLIILLATFCGLGLLWALANLAILIKMHPQGESTERSEKVFELSRKMLRGSFDQFKFVGGVGLIATLVFYLTIMGAVDHFKTFTYSTAYIVGAANAIIISGLSAILSNMTLARVINFARFSVFDAFDTARRSANFQSFFFLIWTLLGLSLWLVLHHRNNEESLQDPAEMKKLVKTLLFFTFGTVTVAIGNRICNSVYSKASEMAIDNLSWTQNRLPRNHKHPALILKALGENFNKCTSNILDSLVYLLAGISLTVYTAAQNVVGADQQGEIIFELQMNNIYLPILSFAFSLIFVVFFNILAGFFLRPSSDEQIRRHFVLQKYVVFGFLAGFQSLAAYLALPAQFFIKELGTTENTLKHPYLAYLCILFGMILYLLMGLGSEITTTHPWLVNIISTSCSTGAATNIIYGLSFGYFFTFVPFVLIAGILFLCNWWLGAFGVGLACIGYLFSAPLSLSATLTLSYLDNASYISYIADQEQSLIQTLITSAQSRKDHQPQALTSSYGILGFLGFMICQQFIASSFSSSQPLSSLKSPSVFAGLLLGAMYPYFTSSSLIRSIHKTYLAIPYDLRLQIQEIPSMANGSIDSDFVRTNKLFGLQCVLALRRFVVLLYFPMVVLGIGFGPECVLGFLAGSSVSTAQLGLSSVISGSIWSTTKKEITSGAVRDSDENFIKGDSEWARAAEVGNQVGQPLKDAVGSSIHLMTVYGGFLSLCFGQLYASIHGK